jgi:hypothetical protein
LPGVYLTKDFGNAVRYSFMLNADEEVYRKWILEEPNGYVFEFDGNDFKSITPDEDELGGFLIDLIKKSTLPSFLSDIVNKIPNDLKYRLSKENVSFKDNALAGKWLIRNSMLSDSIISYLMKNRKYNNIVHYESLYPNAIWVIPKPNEKFLKDKNNSYNSTNGYKSWCKRYGKRQILVCPKCLFYFPEFE